MDHALLGDATARSLQFALATAQRDSRVPSVVAAVARRAEPVWFGAAGEVGTPAEPAAPDERTQYRVGSITKTMVAVCVLRLVERGLVDLTDPIGEYLDDAPAPGSTVYQLLSHTAGLASETPAPWWERTSGEHRPALRDILTADPLRHAPGRTFHYSNPGFGLLGALVAARTGRPWFDVLHDEVLVPLGMTSTTYSPRDPHALGWAVHPWADVVLPEPTHDHGLLAAAGQVWSTPGDLCRFGVFLGGDRGAAEDGTPILSADTLRLMRTPASAPAGEEWAGTYGLGVQLFRFGAHVYVGHSGSMPGFLAMLFTSVRDGLTVAVQANAWSGLPLADLTAGLLDTVRQQEPTMPEPWRPAAHVDAATFELAGTWYWGAVPMSLTARADGELALAGIGARGRAAHFRRDAAGRWVGQDGYYAGEVLEPRRDGSGALTYLDIGSFVFTRAPYGPAELVPDGLELGDWQT